MKKLVFALIAVAAFAFSSCSNDDIDIKNGDVTVSVSLDNFFSSYNFTDNRYNLSLSDSYRAFNSDYGKYIEVRTLVYNENGVLVDSLLTYEANANNAVTGHLNLKDGTYTFVSTLTFSDDNKGDGYWQLQNKENLHTAVLNNEYSQFQWSIMSYAAKTVSVTNGNASVNMQPAPVGATVYFTAQNFQYQNEASYGTVVDNGIRELALYTQQKAVAFKLDPSLSASEKYVYNADAGSTNWWYLKSMEPSDFEDESGAWTYFKTNVYGITYILAPRCSLVFGCSLDGEEGFYSFGKATYTIQSGVTQLAYWDWFKVGNPYFGPADNSHWNTYDSTATSKPFLPGELSLKSISAQTLPTKSLSKQIAK